MQHSILLVNGFQLNKRVRFKIKLFTEKLSNSLFRFARIQIFKYVRKLPSTFETCKCIQNLQVRFKSNLFTEELTNFLFRFPCIQIFKCIRNLQVHSKLASTFKTCKYIQNIQVYSDHLFLHLRRFKI